MFMYTSLYATAEAKVQRPTYLVDCLYIHYQIIGDDY